MIDYRKSYIVMGADNSGRSEVATKIASDFGVARISLDDFKFLPKLEVLEEMKRKKDYSLYPTDTKLNAMIALRKNYPNIKNFNDLGYKKDFEQSLNDKLGQAAVDLYNKQFETMLLKEICECKELTNQSVILEASSTLPIDFNKVNSSVMEQIKKEFPDNYKEMFKDESLLDNSIVKETILKFNNRWQTKLPADKTKWPTSLKNDSKKADRTAYLTSKTDYDELSNTTIETEKICENGGISNTKVSKVTEECFRANASKQQETQSGTSSPDSSTNNDTADNDDKPKKPKVSIFKKLFGLFKMITGISLIQFGFKKLKNLFKPKQKDEADQSYDNGTVQNVTQEEIDQVLQEEKTSGKSSQTSEKSGSEKSNGDPDKKKEGEQDGYEPGE